MTEQTASSQKGTVIICMLAVPPPDVIDGTIDECHRCHRGIVVSPASRQWAQEAPPPVNLLCSPCGIALLRTDPDWRP